MNEYETIAATLGGHVNVPIGIALSMASDPQYRESLGIGKGRHYRRSAGVGCFHIVINGSTASLHKDRIDPRHDLLGHLGRDVCGL